MQNKDIVAALDVELDNCIRKLRNAVYGYEVRTFITEYEELMFKKSDMVTQKFINDNEKHKETIRRMMCNYSIEHEKRLKYLTNLQIVQGIAIIILAMSVIMR